MTRIVGLREFPGDLPQPSDPHLALDKALDARMPQKVATFCHISDTCRTGPATAPLAVVDEYGQVYGLESLRVADASMMPDTVQAPLTGSSPEPL